MNTLSLFSGIGGLDIAAEWAGFKTVAFCERDKFCKSVLSARWPNVRIYDDVRTIATDELPPIELVVGGYPCQPFSHAGKRGGHADERHLWPTPVAQPANGTPEMFLERKRKAVAKGSKMGICLTDLQLVVVAKERGMQGRGKLNPRWLGWLMGYPDNWTECECSATQ